MSVIRNNRIIRIGAGFHEISAEGMMICFNESAPDYLAEYCCILDSGDGGFDICVGDTMQIGAYSYRITAIGEVALKNYAALGHLVVRFDGADTPAQPGTIHVTAAAIPPISVGTVLAFLKTS